MSKPEATPPSPPAGDDAWAAETPPAPAPAEQSEVLPRPFIGDILPDPLRWFTYT